MKIVTEDYIDYTAGEFGVRVRRNLCRSIIMERCSWMEYGADFPLPVESRFIDLPRNSMSSVTSLACNVSRYEESRKKREGISELRKVLSGKISFDEARVGVTE